MFSDTGSARAGLLGDPWRGRAGAPGDVLDSGDVEETVTRTPEAAFPLGVTRRLEAKTQINKTNSPEGQTPALPPVTRPRHTVWTLPEWDFPASTLPALGAPSLCCELACALWEGEQHPWPLPTGRQLLPSNRHVNATWPGTFPSVPSAAENRCSYGNEELPFFFFF